jgi:glutathione S-transferase
MAADATTLVIGSYLSPYVRKVLVCLALKGVAYRVDPLTPFLGDDDFTALSPLRRVPVLIDSRVTLADSSVICQYLEDRYPNPALYPADVAERARARWFEEYADTRMGEVFIWHFFNQLVIRRFVWGEAADEGVVERARREEIPAILDYLEAAVPAAGYVCGDLSIADVSIATFFRTAAFARYQVDAERWPKVARYVDRVLALEPFAGLRPFEELCSRTPIPQQREALAAAGAPIAGQTFATATPRRGIMPI